MPVPLRLNTVLPVRQLSTDMARLKNTNQAASSDAPFAAGAAGSVAAPGLPAAGGVAQIGAVPAMGGPTGQRILAQAREAMRLHPEETYYFSDINHSCASFASVVLLALGLLGKIDRSAQGLSVAIGSRGAVLVLPRNSAKDPATLNRLSLGDLVFFHKTGDIFHHVGFYSGNGLLIAAGSAGGRVHEYPVNHDRRFIAAYRYP